MVCNGDQYVRMLKLFEVVPLWSPTRTVIVFGEDDANFHPGLAMYGFNPFTCHDGGSLFPRLDCHGN